MNQGTETTTLYSSKAEKYAKYRWDYAPQAVQTIIDSAQISAESTVVDIGAGTGILTRHFVDKVKRIYAIEPNLAMRRCAVRDLGQHAAFRMIEGRAEATNLPQHSIDLITVAQAIHWFEPQATKTEFSRILKPRGWLSLLRNYGTNDKLAEAINRILVAENGVDTSVESNLPAGKPMSYFYGHANFKKINFPFTLQETWKYFFGALCSAANMPDEDNPLYPNLERAARTVFDSYSTNDLLEVTGETELYLGQLSQP